MTVNAELSVEGRNKDFGAVVQKKLQGMDGVTGINIDLEAQKVIVTFDEGKARLVDIKQAIMEEGYAVTEL